jgi:hypothetical protein
VFQHIVVAKEIESIDLLMEDERSMIIEEFQKLVLNVKNEQNAQTESKKVEGRLC